MVRIVVDNDLVTIPVPAVYKLVVVGRHAKEKAIEAESFPVAAAQTPNMSLSESAGKTSMFPRLVNVIMNVASTCVVSDPLIVSMNVGCFWMAGLIAKGTVGISLLLGRFALLLGCIASLLRCIALLLSRGWATRGDVPVPNVAATLFVAFPTLAYRWHRRGQQHC